MKLQIDDSTETKALATITSQSTDVLTNATIKISNQSDYDLVASAVKAIKPILKEIDEAFDQSIDAAHASHKAALAAKDKYAAPLKLADKMARVSMSDWVTIQDRIRQETQRQAERERQAAEAKARQEQEAEAAAEAAALADLGLSLQAQVVPPVTVSILPAVQEQPKTEGVFFVETWSYTIVDSLLIPPSFMMPNDVAIMAMVKTMKGLTKIPGIAVEMKKVPRIR